MTQQELIDQNVRMTMGDLMVQIIVLKSRVAELEAAAALPPQMPSPRPNGDLEDRRAFDG